MLTDLLGTTIPRLAAPLFRDIVWRGPSHDVDGEPCLYLTFDDGPHPNSTPILLDFLSATETPASFFFSGSQAERFPDLVQATTNAGHRVGSHGWRHKSAWGMSRREALASFERTEAILQDLIGGPVRDLRPPFGRFTPSLRRWCRDGGRRLVMWDLMPGDFLPMSPISLSERVAKRMISSSNPGSVVVLHESERSAEIVVPAVERAIDELRRKGWIIASL